MKTEAIRVIRIFSVIVALGVSACGGGGSSTCTSNVATLCDTLDASNVPSNVTPAVTSASADGSLQLSLSDASAAPMSSVAPGQSGTLRALLKDGNGAALPNVAVTFTTTDMTGVFIPSSGTALSDSTGMALVSLPAGTQAGAFTVTANALVGGRPAIAALGYGVTFPALALGTFSVTPQPLSAGGNASISVTVLNGTTAYGPPLLVAFSSPCNGAGKAAIGTPVLTQNGVATASYTDKGCGVADTVTASVVLGGSTVSRTGVVSVLPATAGSIKFVSADTTNIALKGTGGFGRQEFATLKFRVFDTTGNPVSGKSVGFVFADLNTPPPNLGGLTLNPSSATSAADGTVTTLVAAGTMPTSVRVIASTDGATTLVTTLSNILVLSTGVPDQNHFSLATQTGNCEGWDFEQTCSIVTATLGDHFGNPAPDGTAVNFTSEGGVIGASCVTGSLPDPGATPVGQTTNSQVGPGSGTCSVTLRASQPRPANGRVTVLAYALGEESFVDVNGNNVFDAGDTFVSMSPDIFRNDDESGVTLANPNGTWSAGEPCIGPNTNTTCSSLGDGQYHGVLRIPQIPSAQTLRVSQQLVQLFSGSHANFSFNPPVLTCAATGTVDVQVNISDDRGNFMPAGTTIAFSTLFGTGAGVAMPAQFTVPNVVPAIGHVLSIPGNFATLTCPGGNGKLIVTVTTPNGIQTVGSKLVTP